MLVNCERDSPLWTKANTKIAAARLKPLATRNMDSTECRRSRENKGGPMATPA